MITQEIKGNILDTELDLIAHGVNCQNVMGSGVAKALFEKYPEVKTKYHEYCKSVPEQCRIATVQPINTEDRTIYNCFTQFNFGYDGKRYVNYYAIAHCFKLLSVVLKGQTIAIPKIGCGLAGGDWFFVKTLINDATGDDLDVWVYDNSVTKHGDHSLG